MRLSIPCIIGWCIIVLAARPVDAATRLRRDAANHNGGSKAHHRQEVVVTIDNQDEDTRDWLLPEDNIVFRWLQETSVPTAAPTVKRNPDSDAPSDVPSMIPTVARVASNEPTAVRIISDPPSTLESNAPTDAPTSRPPDPTLLMTAIDNDNDLTTFGSALRLVGLDLTLSDGVNRLTVFAPVNEAWTVAIDDDDDDYLALLLTPPWQEHLRQLLLHHVVGAVVPATALTPGTNIPMLNGEVLRVANDAADIALEIPEGRNGYVLQADAAVVTNGILHIVSAVLLPSYCFVLVPAVVNRPEFSIFYQYLVVTNVETQLQEFGPWTVLAPSNSALAAYSSMDLTSESGLAAAVALVQDHVVPGLYPTSRLVPGQVLATLHNTTLLVTISEQIFLNTAALVQPNLLAYNGLVHGIDAVLVVPPA
jgi:uncharacterized surface protein with fasciclin (FAS1) repeats